MLKLHVGAGPNKLEGYVNIDMKKAPHIDLVCNALDVDKYYADQSVDEIYSSHMFEHLDRHEQARFLRMCHSLLKKDATLFLAMPLLDYIIEVWQDPKRTDFGDENLMNACHGIQRDPWDYHKRCYTKKVLFETLKSHGFEVTKEERGRPGYGKNSPGIMLWCKRK